MKKANPRDLSQIAQGRLIVRIYGCYSKEVTLESGTFAQYIAEAHRLKTGETILVTDPTNTPWEFISFDQRRGVLLVKLFEA